MGKKILLIMGASSDCGCELIRRTIKKYDLILAHYCHMNSQLEELKQGEYGDKLQLLQADFMDRDSIDDMIDTIKEKEWIPTHIVHFSAPKFRYTKYDRGGIMSLRKNCRHRSSRW